MLDREQARAGALSFNEAVLAHRSALRALALRLCRNAHDADDLVQDALERGLKHFDRIAPDSNVRSWLLAVLHNRFIDLCRRRARRPREAALDAEPAPPPPDPDDPPAWAHITEEQVRQALGQLAVEFRRVYELHVLEKRSYDEIATLLGVPRATVGTRLLRARRRLRDILMPRGEA